MKLRSIFVCLLLFGVCIAAGAENAEIRAVWMDRRSIPKTEQGIRDQIKGYDEAGINILLPEVIFNGYSAYKSSYLTQQDLWNGLDVLSIIIDEAHMRGMEVHPWVWVFRAGNKNDKGGILTQHPNWAVVYEDGGSVSANGSYWLCPSTPGVRVLLMRAFRELAEKYPVDGIHLDYIRFDNQSPSASCYNASCRLRYTCEYGTDPADIEPFTKPVIAWHLWRESLITGFLQEIVSDLEEARPGIRISAAVAPLPDGARLSYLQDWTSWANNNYLYFISPMDYTPDIDIFKKYLYLKNKGLVNYFNLAPGIGLHLIKDPDIAARQVQYARDSGFAGVCLFCGSYIDENVLHTLKENVFQYRSSVPEKYPPGSLGHIQSSPPPIFIPNVVLPLPEVEIPYCGGRARITIDRTNLGEEASQKTDVTIEHDGSYINITFEIGSPAASSIAERDGPVFTDDSVELFLQPPGKDYYHFAVNTIGTMFDEKNMAASWNADWSASAVKVDGKVIIKMSIPLAALGTGSDGMWRANFCRNIKTDEGMEYTCWSPTYGPYHTPIRYGYLVYKQP